MSLAHRLADVRARVADAARAAGRSPESVTLVAVSKFHPVDAIVEAHGLGVRDFGENIVQELVEKASAVADLGLDVRWHFIGRLQRNKINLLLRHPIHRMHTIDRAELADAVAQRAPEAGLDVLVQVNIGREPQKGGALPEETEALARHVLGVARLRLRGLMAIPPDGVDAVPYFAEMTALAEKVRAIAPQATELSLGMTHDFTTAIAAGSTHVRVGTAIFGSRRPET
ncbi:MAG: YggS family pyridoxal phosphate-dependent enzyme [Myxococcota bacterium]